MVVCYHAGGRVNNIADKENFAIGRIFETGYIGVDLFFVISGFIIAHVHFSDIGRRERYIPYIYKRLTRIYPLYWILFLAVMPLYFVVPGAGDDFQRNPVSLIGSFFLLPVPPKQVIGVAWSLVPEMIFYAMFGLAILNRRLGVAMLSCWSLLILVNQFVDLAPNYAISELLSVRFFGFFVGIGIAVLMPAWKIPPLPLFVGAFLFLALPHALLQSGETQLFLSYFVPVYLAGGILVGLAVSLDNRNQPAPKPLVLLGNATYSVYLFHWLVGWILQNAIQKLGIGASIPAIPCFLFLVVAMLAAGYTVHVFLEKPIMALSRNGLRRFFV